MYYCIEGKRMVYGCDHSDCKNAAENNSSVGGMNWCYVGETRVYSCDHYECKNGGRTY